MVNFKPGDRIITMYNDTESYLRVKTLEMHHPTISGAWFYKEKSGWDREDVFIPFLEELSNLVDDNKILLRYVIRYFENIIKNYEFCSKLCFSCKNGEISRNKDDRTYKSGDKVINLYSNIWNRLYVHTLDKLYLEIPNTWIFKDGNICHIKDFTYLPTELHGFIKCNHIIPTIRTNAVISYYKNLVDKKRSHHFCLEDCTIFDYRRNNYV